MKIAIVHPRWTLRGGAEKYLVTLVGELVRRGHQIDLLANRLDLPLPEGVRLRRIPLIRFPLWLRLPWFAWMARRALAATDHDVSFSLGKIPGTDVVRPGGGCHRAYEERILGAILDQDPTEALIKSFVNEISPFNLVNRRIEDAMFARRPRIIAVSSLVRDDIRRHYPSESLDITVIWNGRDPLPPDAESARQARRDLIGELNLPERALVMLHVATNPPLKGFTHFMRAMHRFPKVFLAGFKPYLVVLGATRPGPLIRLARSLGLEERLRFVPFSADVSRYYRAADLLVHPTLYDAFANVCLEAQSFALPVLTSRLNGGAEIYTPWVDGLVIERPWDHEKLAGMIMTAASECRLAEIGRRGHELLLKHTQAANFDQVEALLARVAQPQPPSGQAASSSR